MLGLGRKRERLWRDGGGVACSMLVTESGLAKMFLELCEYPSSSLIFTYEGTMQACTHTSNIEDIRSS